MVQTLKSSQRRCGVCRAHHRMQHIVGFASATRPFQLLPCCIYHGVQTAPASAAHCRASLATAAFKLPFVTIPVSCGCRTEEWTHGWIAVPVQSWLIVSMVIVSMLRRSALHSDIAELTAESRSFHGSLSNGSSHATLLGLLCGIGTFFIQTLWRAPALLYFMQGLLLLEKLM
ncbi:hypothetical protein WJX77_009826 [Trebouxia sp. C0004]